MDGFGAGAAAVRSVHRFEVRARVGWHSPPLKEFEKKVQPGTATKKTPGRAAAQPSAGVGLRPHTTVITPRETKI
eukprot:gene10909-biopygen3825